MSNENLGKDIYDLAHELFPICRSITGNGVRKTLGIIQQYLPELTIHEVPSFTSCFDWTVPLEWNIEDAYIIDPNGNKIVDIKNNNLHILGYSIPISKKLNLSYSYDSSCSTGCWKDNCKVTSCTCLISSKINSSYGFVSISAVV